LRESVQVAWLKDDIVIASSTEQLFSERGPSEIFAIEIDDTDDPCQNFNTSGSHYNVLSNYSLQICSSSESDKGTYQCQISTKLEDVVMGPLNSVYIESIKVVATEEAFPWWIVVAALLILLILIILSCCIWQCRKRKEGKGYYGMDVEGIHNQSDIYYTTEDADSIMNETDTTSPKSLLKLMEKKITKEGPVSEMDGKTPIFTPNSIKHISDVERSAGSLGSLLEDDSFLDKGMDEDGSFRERYAE